MKSSLCWLLVVLSLLLVLEAECRRRDRHRSGRHGRMRQRQRDRRYGHHRRRGALDGWSDLMRRLEFGYGRQRNWWDGPNVCHSEESEEQESELNDITHHHKAALQVCEESQTAYRCKTTIQSADGQISKTELYECCHGYARERSDFGCPERLRMRNLLTTARTLGLNDLLTAVNTVGLEEDLTRGNFTLFAPVDGAFPLPTGPGIKLQDRHGALMVSRPMMDEMEDNLQAVLLGHLVLEPRRASSFADEEVLATGSPYDSTVRINFYSRPEKLTTANCVKVLSTDNMATNGVIHTVEEVLPTVTSSIADIIQSDKDFTFLKTALARANLVSTFRGDGQFTLFAPTNAAFDRLPPRLLDRLLRGDPKCMEKVLKQHVLPHVICSTVITGRAKSRNLLHNYVNLTRSDDNKVFVNDAQVVRADVMATNGVLHVIDAVLVPDDALDLVSVANKNDLTELVNLVSRAKLASTLQKAENVTVFAPSNEAIQALPPALLEKLMTDDGTMLRDILTYHVVPEGELSSRQLYNDRLVDTLNADNKIRINQFSSFPFGHRHVITAQCARIVAHNVAACNGIVHVIDKVLLPPSGNLVDVLALDSQYSTLVGLLKSAGLADALQGEGPFTVFAPTNEAFRQLGKEKLRSLQNDPEELANVLKMHVIKENLCCTGIFRNPWWHLQRMQTLSGSSLFLTRDRRDSPLVNDVMIGSCDNMATNGVVHSIDSVLLPMSDPWYMFP